MLNFQKIRSPPVQIRIISNQILQVLVRVTVEEVNSHLTGLLILIHDFLEHEALRDVFDVLFLHEVLGLRGIAVWLDNFQSLLAVIDGRGRLALVLLVLQKKPSPTLLCRCRRRYG